VLVTTFVAVFGVVALVELVDRTNFALIGLAARRSALACWLGATSAFIATSAIAVGIGTAFIAVLGGDLRYVQLGGGIFILGYAAYLALVPEADRAPPTGRSAFATAFLLIFLLELGDTTMILMILFTGSTGNPLLVFAAGAMGLALVAGTACTIGARLGAKVEPRSLERAVVAILGVIGAVTVALALDPGLLPSVLR
jgi:putative Ca2+/H+ antiporter (TMEM165/GDT1 family)